MVVFIGIVAIIFGVIYFFTKQSKFGRAPQNLRLEKAKNSQNYKDGKFQNLSFTPDLAEGVSYYKVLKEFIFDRSKRSIPSDTIPSNKTNLHELDRKKNVVVWFGHSSYFIQIDGKRILVDPVFSGSASPLKFTTRSFKGSDIYTTDDIPEIDYLFITHDHWDHLDYETILKLKPQIKKVITGLGTAEHLEYWGYDTAQIYEKDWNETVTLEEGFVVNTTSGRHFSGRTFKRNQAIWMSFVLQTPSMKIFLGGDSGYDTHFETIGKTHGPFDLVILECGQYHQNWKNIHLMPEELIQAAQDLKAKKILPVHWAKFSLALHAWDDSILRVKAESERKKIPILHPMIGEEVNLNADSQIFKEWWIGLN